MLSRHTLVAIALALAVTTLTPLHAEVSAERVEGLRDQTPRWHVLTGAKLVVSPEKTIDNGTVVLRDGVIVAVGANVAVPPGARVWKLDGKTVYAGFIDLASSLGVPAAMRQPPQLSPWARAAGASPTPEARLGARAMAATNRMVRADAEVAPLLELKPDEIKAVRELGFTSVLAAPSAGVFRGQSALLNLADAADPKSLVRIPRAAQHLANEYERGYSAASYPTSAMGAIALVRQTLYDARWYRSAQDAKSKAERPEQNATLAALADAIAARQAVIYQAEGEQDFLRIAKVRDEFNLRAVALGNGLEYRRAAELKSLNLPVIVPLNFPGVPEVENPDSALDVPLEVLQHWERAPSNLAHLAEQGVAFAITANGLLDAKEFWPQLRLAVKRGLTGTQALAGLTTVPARLIGANDLGTIEAGRLANLIVASGDLFANDAAEIEISFVDGRPYTTAAFERFDARGKWKVAEDGSVWDIVGTRQRPQLRTDTANCDVLVRARQLVLTVPCAKDGAATETIVAEFINNSLRGTRQAASGVTRVWAAQRVAAFVEPAKDERKEPALSAMPTTYPAGAYSVAAPVKPAEVLVKNATVWTSAKPGRMDATDLLIRDGKIAAIGKSLNAPNANVIDARGRHVTPGIIDPHSHTATIGGLNEASSSITAEVRVADVIDATDVSIYRQLAGGVTAANVLHGSANAIGGQNQVIKMRWGRDAEALKFADAMPGIKFALGENVKQANWGDNNTTRYPQTRMGVEQIMRDGFQATREYQRRWAAWRTNKVGAEPRRDLQLDALAEILDKKRVIHIHSYRADEILMFTKLAKEFGLPVATFQHVLEGYKVADAIAGIGAGGSSFSDWWGYKMEVLDAIPFNGALMHKAGVLTSFNSDSDELARRLNTEAAKAVKYGGVSETDALGFVTINAAKQLRIDKRVGSLEVGKDADFVIWNTHPLSTQAIAEQTWIDGARYFDLASDTALRAEAERERRRLVAKALPLRLARTSGPPRSGGDAPPPQAAQTRDVIEYMAMESWLHRQKQYRDGYWNGGAWHECTEDAR